MLTLKGYSLLKSLLNDEEIIKIKSDWPDEINIEKVTDFVANL